MRRPERRAEAVGVARLFQQLARLCRVVFKRRIALRILNRRRHNAGRRGGVTGKSDLSQRLTVNGVVDRLTYFRIIKRLLRHVQADITLHDRGRTDQIQLAVLLQPLRLLVGNREGEVSLAGLQHRRAGVVVDNRTPGDGIQLRIAFFPVAIPLLHLHKIGLIPGDKLIRPGADRMEADLFAIFFQRRRRDHRRRRVRQNIDKGRERLLQSDFHRGGINHLGGGDMLKQVVALKVVILVAGAVEIDLHRFGVEVGAVLELNAGAQLDSPGQAVRAGLIAFRQHVHQLHIFIEAEQPLIKRFRHRLRQRVVGVVRIEGGEVGADGDNRILRRPGGRGGDGAEQAGRQQPFA